MTRIIMHGCNGKMGQVISDLVKNDPNASIVAGIDISDNIQNDYPVFKSVFECNVEADVIIDFASAMAIKKLLRDASAKKLPLVLCTTGLTRDLIGLVETVSKTIPILRSANMSLGVNTLLKLVKTATQILAAADFDIEIVEKHHNQKVDSPSGTALALAEAINDQLYEDCDYKCDYKYERFSERVPRSKKEIGISAVRGGTIVGEHEIIFAGIDEVIELKHTAYSKAIFAKGAISAAKFLVGKEVGMYSMPDVIDN